ncbi:MAG: aspartate carbamoyltransferase catalytic subunit, partial [Mangrovicoccus sp.]|nr:aspartate carbamoyltransferase catalytic subunit [Mangrovicoccus sp.]
MGQAAARDPSTGWEGILQPGEKLLWQGQPDRRIAWEEFNLKRAAFGAVIIGFSLFWTAGAMQAAPPGLPGLILPLAGLFFLFQGLRVAGGYLWLDAYRRRHSWYSLSTQRAFIATDMLGRRKLRDFPITPETPLSYEQGDPGSIWFSKEYRSTKNGSQKHFVG